MKKAKTFFMQCLFLALAVTFWALAVYLDDAPRKELTPLAKKMLRFPASLPVVAPVVKPIRPVTPSSPSPLTHDQGQNQNQDQNRPQVKSAAQDSKEKDLYNIVRAWQSHMGEDTQIVIEELLEAEKGHKSDLIPNQEAIKITLKDKTGQSISSFHAMVDLHQHKIQYTWDYRINEAREHKNASYQLTP
jgi:hypothetical protein